MDEEVRSAASDAQRRPQAIAFSAVTGAGKTVMAAALIERLLIGGEGTPPVEDLTLLWLSHQPRINEQSLRRILSASSALLPQSAIVIESDFDRETLEPGMLYFLNTQKLGSDKLLTTPSDIRQYTIWETIANTVEERSGNFILLVDEAHHGTTNARGRNGSNRTIVQQFLFGDPKLGLTPVRLVVGISATPQRFTELLQHRGDHTVRPVPVDPQRVRESGLIKERIEIVYSEDTETANTDFSLLEEAARSWAQYSRAWDAYCSANQSEARVTPRLVEVEDAPAGMGDTRTDLAACIDRIMAAAPNEQLRATSFVHAFDREGAVDAGAYDIRRVDPEDITDDEAAKIIFFKRALSTGWDCPAAEVMMSFRSAADHTHIAQLIGRFIRAPLARRIDTDESLNGAQLFLPRYNRAATDTIISYLTDDATDDHLPTDVTTRSQVVTLMRRPASEPQFERLEQLPSWRPAARRPAKDTQRLSKLLTCLSRDGIGDNAKTQAQTEINRLLHERLQANPPSETSPAPVASIEKRTVDLRVAEVADPMSGFVAASDRDVRAWFAAVGRAVGGGVHSAFWNYLTGAKPDEDPLYLRRVVSDLLSRDETRQELEEACARIVSRLLETHRRAINALPDDQRQSYDQIAGSGASRTLNPDRRYPERISHRPGDDAIAFAKHIYVSESAGTFTAALNSLERQVIDAEIAADDVVGWLRNVDRQSWAVAIPRGTEGLTYPDFLVVRRDGEQFVADLLDPHGSGLPDSVDKAKALAAYAEGHGAVFGRVQLIDSVGSTIRRLDLRDRDVRAAVGKAVTAAQLRDVFETHGFSGRLGP